MLTKTDFKKITEVLNKWYRDGNRKPNRFSKAVIWDDKINEKLTGMFGLSTSFEDYDLNGLFVSFDWSIERWYVYA